jgi:hypothetical protein
MAAGYYFTVTLIDADMRTTTRRFQLVEGTTPGDAITDIGTFIAALKAVTNCGVIKSTLLIPVDPTPTAGAAGSNVDAGATVTGWITQYLKKGTVKWPDPDAGARAGDGSIVLAETDVAAFLELFEATGGIMQVSDAETIMEDGWIKGKLDR